jgi:hypothetical protein
MKKRKLTTAGKLRLARKQLKASAKREATYVRLLREVADRTSVMRNEILAAIPPTLVEAAKRLDIKGNLAKVIDVLNTPNPFVTTVFTRLPSMDWQVSIPRVEAKKKKARKR